MTVRVFQERGCGVLLLLSLGFIISLLSPFLPMEVAMRLGSPDPQPLMKHYTITMCLATLFMQFLEADPQGHYPLRPRPLALCTCGQGAADGAEDQPS